MPTRSCRRSARAGWERSTGRGTRGFPATSRSRFSPTRARAIQSTSPGSSAKRAFSPLWSTRTSPSSRAGRGGRRAVPRPGARGGGDARRRGLEIDGVHSPRSRSRNRSAVPAGNRARGTGSGRLGRCAGRSSPLRIHSRKRGGRSPGSSPRGLPSSATTSSRSVTRTRTPRLTSLRYALRLFFKRFTPTRWMVFTPSIVATGATLPSRRRTGRFRASGDPR